MFKHWLIALVVSGVQPAFAEPLTGGVTTPKQKPVPIGVDKIEASRDLVDSSQGDTSDFALFASLLSSLIRKRIDEAGGDVYEVHDRAAEVQTMAANPDADLKVSPAYGLVTGTVIPLFAELHVKKSAKVPPAQLKAVRLDIRVIDVGSSEVVGIIVSNVTADKPVPLATAAEMENPKFEKSPLGQFANKVAEDVAAKFLAQADKITKRLRENLAPEASK